MITSKQKRWKQAFKKAMNNDDKTSNRILLVDGLNLFIRSFSATATMNSDGEHVGGIYGSLISLRYAIKNLRPDRCIVVFDGRNGSKRRRKIYEDYKKRSRNMKNLNRKVDWKSEKQEEESAKRQLNRFIQYLTKLPVQSFTIDNTEADDAIAYLCTNVYDKRNTIVMSSDKDYLQLVGQNNTNVWSPTKKKLYNTDKVRKDYDINPKNILFWRVVEGDKSDNIPGVKGVGIGTLQKHLSPIFETNENIDINTYIRYINMKYQDTNSKRFEKLYNNTDIVKRNHKLMQLQETMLSGDHKTNIINIVKNNKINTLDQSKLRQYFMEDKLYNQVKNFQVWFNSFRMLNSKANKFNKKLEG